MGCFGFIFISIKVVWSEWVVWQICEVFSQYVYVRITLQSAGDFTKYDMVEIQSYQLKLSYKIRYRLCQWANSKVCVLLTFLFWLWKTTCNFYQVWSYIKKKWSWQKQRVLRETPTVSMPNIDHWPHKDFRIFLERDAFLHFLLMTHPRKVQLWGGVSHDANMWQSHFLTLKRLLNFSLCSQSAFSVY